MDEKKEGYEKYLKLPPTSDAKDIDEYIDALDNALESDDILNIAISGSYGSGKSSFLRTYFDKRKKDEYNNISVSLGMYDKETIKVGQRKKNEYYQSIEKSILQQLLYQVEEKEVPLSRFNRISKYSRIKFFGLSSIFLIGLFLVFSFIFPNILDSAISNVQNLYETLSFLNFNINKLLIPLNFVLIIITVIFMFYLNYIIIETLKNKISISKFKFKDAEIEINNKSESIFNKYLDEIIYFFQCTKYNVVILEDLDRIDESSLLIQKLKELNQLINASSKINRRIKFIFAIKDDFFTKADERTKFFDKLIPIIPVSSYSNSNEIIWGKFKKIYGEKEKYGDIDKRFIDDISVFIDDMRIIKNTMSEFVLYKDKLKNASLDDKKLFGMVMYKNIYPKEYSQLLSEEGTFVDTFVNKNKNLNIVMKDIEDEIEILENQKKEAEKEKLGDLTELKKVLLFDFLNLSYHMNNLKVMIHNNEFSIEDFLKEDFDISLIKTCLFRINVSYNIKPEEQVFSLFGGKANFLERLDTLEKTKEKKLTEIQLKINSFKENILKNREKTLEDLINQYGEDKFINSNNSFEKFLLSRGFVTNDYSDYISIFKEGNLTSIDMKFIKSVKKNENLEFSYSLQKIDKVIERLDSIDFNSNCILNFDILDHLLKKPHKYKEELKKINNQFKTVNSENYKFIERYELISKEFNSFIKPIMESTPTLWKCIFKNRVGDKKYIDRWIMKYLENDKSLKMIDDDFIDYINKHPNFYDLYQNEKIAGVVQRLIELEIKFSNLDGNKNEDFIEAIYKNSLYKLNDKMVRSIIKYKTKKIVDEKNNDLTIIFKSDELEIMKKYIKKYFISYFDNCYSNEENHENDLDVIIDLLNDDYASDPQKRSIIEKEKIVFDNIAGIDTQLYTQIYKAEKLEFNWNNIISLYIFQDELSLDIIKCIEKSTNSFNSENVKIFRKNHDSATVDIFQKELILSERLSLEKYLEIIPCIDITIDEISDIEISSDKMEVLITNNKIIFNKSNYEKVKDDYEQLVFKFIKLNSEEYLENHDEYDISGLEDQLLVSRDINDDFKQDLIDEDIINIMEVKIDNLLELIFEDRLLIKNEKFDLKVFKSNLSLYRKCKYLKKIIERLGTEQIVEYIQIFDEVYKKIGTKTHSTTILYNEYIVGILEHLKRAGVVSSYYHNEKNDTLIIRNKRAR